MKTENIINAMSTIVDNIMTHFQSDYIKYDMPYIKNAESSDFPMLWVCAPMHTNLFAIGSYANKLLTNSREQYLYAQGSRLWSYCIDDAESGYDMYLITEDAISAIKPSQAKEVVRDILTPVINKIKDTMPKRFKVKVKFQDVDLEEIKELIREGEGKPGVNLLEVLKRFHHYTQLSDNHYVVIRPDFYYEKKFRYNIMVDDKSHCSGAITCHGYPDTGYIENGSCQITPSYGWEMNS